MEKILDAYIIYNWKTSSVKIVKKKPKRYNPFEIPIKIHIKFMLPEPKEIEAKGEIVIPETQVKDMIIEGLVPKKEEEEK